MRKVCSGKKIGKTFGDQRPRCNFNNYLNADFLIMMRLGLRDISNTFQK